jgi:hypothetical protein
VKQTVLLHVEIRRSERCRKTNETGSRKISERNLSVTNLPSSASTKMSTFWVPFLFAEREYCVGHSTWRFAPQEYFHFHSRSAELLEN